MRFAAVLSFLVTLFVTSPAAAEDEASTGDWRIPTGIAMMATGAAAIMVGTTVGTIAAAEYGSLDCPDDVCPPELAEDADDYNALREPSGLTIAIGGVLSVIGGAFLFSGLTDPDERVTVDFGPGSIHIGGRF